MFSVFFAANFPASSPQKKYNLKKIKHIFFSFFADDFPATIPPKNISFKK